MIKTSIITLFLLISLSISGCSQSATSVFNKDDIYAQNLQYTKVNKVIINNEVTAILNATYLNSVNSKKWDNDSQNFILSVYNTIDDKKYTITLNDKEAQEIVILDKNSSLYKNIAYRNNWAVYKLYTFKKEDNNTVELKAYNNFGSTTINFIKE